MSSPRQKAKDLIELAADIHTSQEERMSAAVKAVALIRKHDLLAHPLDGFLDTNDETVQAATNIFEALTDPKLVGSLKKVAGRIGRRRRRA